MDALDELEQMHETARADFQKIASAGTNDRAGLWAKLHSELLLHERIEEQFVYDPVVKDLGDQNQQLDRFHEQHETEASQANDMMAALGRLDPSSSEWLTQIQELASMMERHMEEEEQEFWPLIRETWGEDQLDKAGRGVAAAKTAGSAGASIAEALGKAEQALKGG
jgi:hemerythrin-like domain-containing protein